MREMVRIAENKQESGAMRRIRESSQRFRVTKSGIMWNVNSQDEATYEYEEEETFVHSVTLYQWPRRVRVPQ